jgi:ribosomal-protein-alanine N-acetyltransferase
MMTMPETLLGSKVLLRPFSPTDITPEYIGWLNDPEVVRYSNQRFVRHSETSCQRYYDSFACSDNVFMSVRLRNDDRAVGTMTAYLSTRHETVDIGIMIGRRSVWGQGLGQDAWGTLMGWLIDERRIRKVTAGTMRCNKPMIKLMERSGMVLEAVQRKQELLDGLPQDIVYFAKFSDDQDSSVVEEPGSVA